VNLLIIGGSGFIGKSFLNYCVKKKIKINILTTYSKNKLKINKKITNIQQIKVDILNKNYNLKIIKKFKPEIVLYLSWIGIPDFSKENSYKNFSCSRKFLKLILKIITVRKLIVSGSCYELDKKKQNILHFINAKKKLREFCAKFCKLNNITFYWARIFYVYGPLQNKKSLIPHIYSSFKENKFIKINNPFTCNDFIYIDDVIQLLVKLIKSDKVKKNLVDVGTGNINSVNYVYSIIKKYFFNIKVSKKKKKKSNNFFRANTNHNLKKNYISIEDGVVKTLKHLDDHYKNTL
jgi:nucleoside-diphosphate-sugar epimerase